jgi:hypothetical protein
MFLRLLLTFTMRVALMSKNPPRLNIDYKIQISMSNTQTNCRHESPFYSERRGVMSEAMGRMRMKMRMKMRMNRE